MLPPSCAYATMIFFSAISFTYVRVLFIFWRRIWLSDFLALEFAFISSQGKGKLCEIIKTDKADILR